MMATSVFAPVLLPVVQFKESHDLKVDPEQVGTGGATLVAPPYQAMSVGDKATLSVDIYMAGDYTETREQTNTLTAADIGHPISWVYPQAELDILLEGDHLVVSYGIDYATPTVTTGSEEQTLHIVAPVIHRLLARLSVKDFEGDTLDPDAYPDGITLTVELYPGIEVGDWVTLYAIGNSRLILTIYIDQTTIDSQKLEIPLGYEWLAANTGNEAVLTYQYARLGKAGTSMARSLVLRKPLNLPPPIIQGVIREGEDDEYKGYLLGRSTTSGITIDLPEAAIGVNDRVQMVFDGFKPEGYYIADPIVGNPKRFQIPKQYVPANLGKRLNVFYEVTPPGEKVYKSRPFDLHIWDMDGGWPIIQIISPPSSNNTVSLKTVTDAVTFRLRSWTFIAVGQRVRIVARGVLQTGAEETFNLREGATEVLTEDEYYAGQIEAKLPRAFLARLKPNLQFNVTVAISFDGGTNYKQLPMITQGPSTPAVSIPPRQPRRSKGASSGCGSRRRRRTAVITALHW
jgi:hypothetical protein